VSIALTILLDSEINFAALAFEEFFKASFDMTFAVSDAKVAFPVPITFVLTHKPAAAPAAGPIDPTTATVRMMLKIMLWRACERGRETELTTRPAAP